jgi:hypothetical protein
MKELTLTIEDPDDGIKINALPEENLDDNTWIEFKVCCLKYPGYIQSQIIHLVKGSVMAVDEGEKQLKNKKKKSK